MSDLDLKFETWKNKLLDLRKRNNLLNYRDSRRTNLKVKSPEIFALWNLVTENKRPLAFSAWHEVEAGEETTDTKASLATGTTKVAQDGDLVTNLSVREQQRTLRHLRNKAKGILEEQGINALYLSFGTLRWNEMEQTGSFYDAPLVLVPVRLNWVSITSPFTLHILEEEIILNPTLTYKLETEFGLELPEFDLKQNLKEYLAKIKKQVEKKGWEVTYDVRLGLHSFLKVNMYQDLERKKELILQNPIVRALGGDSSHLQQEEDDPVFFDHDQNVAPDTLFQVLDADSSQMDALRSAQKGLSFVLQGPPGTGKSQTIANIIAQCLGQGKKVLFVSEKRAALEVVYKRLNEADLADFCLNLHSYKANKKDILTALGSGLTRSQPLACGQEFQLERLKEHRERLAAYSKAMTTVIEPLHMSIYEVNGYLAALPECKEIIFSLDNVRQTSQQMFNNYIMALERFTNSLGMMSYDRNPWYGAKITRLTYELRHDIKAKLNQILICMPQIIHLCQEIETDLGLVFVPSYLGLQQVLRWLKVAAESPKVPVNWMKRNVLTPLFEEVIKTEKMTAQFSVVKEKVLTTYQDLQGHGLPGFINNVSFSTEAQVNEHIATIQKLLAEDPLYRFWGAQAWQEIELKYQSLEKRVSEYKSLSGELATFGKGIFDVDYNAMYSRFKFEYHSLFKIFKSNYRSDKKILKNLYHGTKKKLTDLEISITLSKLRRLEDLKKEFNKTDNQFLLFFGEDYDAENTDFVKLKEQMVIYKLLRNGLRELKELQQWISKQELDESILTQNYEDLYHGLETDWNQVKKCLEWANKFKKEIIVDSAVHFDFIKEVCSSEETIERCKEYVFLIEEGLKDFNKEFDWFLALFEEQEKFKKLDFSDLQRRFQSCLTNLKSLEDWIDFYKHQKHGRDIGLGPFMEMVENLHIAKADIIPTFKKRFFRLWLDHVLEQFPIVTEFRRMDQEDYIHEFCKLDKQQFHIARERIRFNVMQSIASLFINQTEEMGILKREQKKQRHHLSLRKLFGVIPNLILTLKPCFMMSPLSVSLFLEDERLTFDTVIFDEASQIRTEHAIGAIARSKQVIIVGDNKQLPPTNFFHPTFSDIEFDTLKLDRESDSYESILDEAALLPEYTLLWHYRSQQQDLVAYSNAKIYQNQLISFPANVAEQRPDQGVEYFYVQEGIYGLGEHNGNRKEAQKVAALVLTHIQKFPSRSLGVIAFGEVQQLALEAAIHEMRLGNQQYEFFFMEDKKEAFFVKSLETVQGDERDTIILSIGYAKDHTGVLRMYFGPLSQAGGERRLNVAITRARQNVKLVGSILPMELECSDDSAAGLKLLQGYIHFAINGPTGLMKQQKQQSVKTPRSPFVSALAHFLINEGYEVEHEIGWGGNRISLGIKHPLKKGHYVLGIVCDGPTFHFARTVRERERLREELLEMRGWNIYRLWSTEWVKDPTSEGRRLLNAAKQAILRHDENQMQEIASTKREKARFAP